MAVGTPVPVMSRASFPHFVRTRHAGKVAVTELPYGVSTRAVLEDIERATNPKPKEGKKTLAQDQVNLRAAMLAALDAVRDESDKTQPVRIVLEPKSRGQDPVEFMQLMLANTRLEASLPVNLIILINAVEHRCDRNRADQQPALSVLRDALP